MEPTTKIFADGIYLNRVHDKAPEFVKANVSIHIEKAITWLKSLEPNEKGYITLVGKESKTLDAKGLPKRYFELDLWKPETPSAAQQKVDAQYEGQDAPPITEADVPW